jgi:hypothetical protein
MGANVGYWPKADMRWCAAHVRSCRLNLARRNKSGVCLGAGRERSWRFSGNKSFSCDVRLTPRKRHWIRIFGRLLWANNSAGA